MCAGSLKKLLIKTEYFTLLCLLFFLPLSESLKHILFWCCFVASIGWRISDKDVHRRRPDINEWLLIAMITVSAISTVLNWPIETGTKGVRDTICMTFLFWVMYRTPFDVGTISQIMLGIVLSATIGLLWGLWELNQGVRPRLEFHSAGVVTQSSIYLGISIFVMIGVLFEHSRNRLKTRRIGVAASIVFAVACLCVMGSRGGVVAVIVTGAIFSVMNFRLVGMRRLVLILMSLATVVAGIFCLGNIKSKSLQNVHHLLANFQEEGLGLDGDNDQVRFDLWHLGFVQALRGGDVFFGVGPRNFASIDVEEFEFEEPLTTYRKMWVVPNHAHNLFITKWAEEGAIGLIIFVVFLFRVMSSLVRFRPARGGCIVRWTSGLGALMVPIIGGSFNSPFANEFSWLAMAVMGLWMGTAEKYKNKTDRSAESNVWQTKS